MEENQFLCHSAYLPEVTLDRPVLLLVNYRHRRFIGLNVVSIHRQVTYSVIERPQQVSDILEPVAHGGRWNVHPETLHHLYLPVERKTVNCPPSGWPERLNPHSFWRLGSAGQLRI